ncbi:MAG TPA: HEAT repeat domain-containing protein [Sandaracinaceae bacterium LLY-WYZ-13_1]|nr:HEAT repeat domain-containing protein [Sandaracinaceae bacterium LLY-WYZ-13_1]
MDGTKRRLWLGAIALALTCCGGSRRCEEPAPETGHAPGYAEPEAAEASPEPAPERAQSAEDLEALERAQRDLTDRCAYLAVRRRARERIRGGDLEGALVLLDAYLASEVDPAWGHDADAPRLAAHVRWLAGIDAQLEALGGRWLQRPRRVYLRPGAHARDAPDGAHRGAYGALEDAAVDVWAEVPGGPLLLARPEDAPGFAVETDRYALAGWVARDEVAPEPPEGRPVDVGRPLPIWRGPPIETLDRHTDGAPCTVCGEDGLGFDLYGDAIHCARLSEMCGAPGLTPPSYDEGEPMVNGCADCPDHFRSFRAVGDYCRSDEPGSTWRCAPRGRHLVCTAPDARPAAVAPEPEPAEGSLEAWRRAHPLAEDLATLDASLRQGPGGARHGWLHFQARAHPERLLRAACDPDNRTPDLAFGLLRGAGFFERPLPAEHLPCLRRRAFGSAQLQLALAGVPDPRLREVLEAIVDRPFQANFADSARGALAILEAGEAIGAPLRRFARDEDGENVVNGLLRSYVRHVEDPRPIVPALADLLDAGGVVGHNRGRASWALRRLTGRAFRDADAARAFWASHRDRTVDAWLAEAASDDDPEVRRNAYGALRLRAPTEVGRAALLAGLEDPEVSLRLDAAITLARWGDRRAAPWLVRFLPDHEAFLALGWLASSDLGFADAEGVAERRAAVARWREWAAPSPGR